MTDPQSEKTYWNVDELAAHTGLSKATIWRLKKAGKIPCCQPGGKGSRVMFPANAIEMSNSPTMPHTSTDEQAPQPEQLPGPRPKWMS